MKILFVGDVHIKNDNFPEVDQLESLILSYISENKIPYVILGGDILHHHEKIHTLTMNRALKFMKSISEHSITYVLVGNHDMINNQQFLNENHWMTPIKELSEKIIIIDYPKTIHIDSFKLFMCPYVFPGKFKECFSLIDEEITSYDMIFAHQEFKGCKMGAIISEEGDVWEEDLPLVVSGHIHNRQKPQKNIIYPGTPIQHAFGDSDDNIILEIDLESKNLVEIPTNISNKKIIYSTIDKVKNIDLSKYDGKNIKVVITAKNDEIQSFKKTTTYQKLSKLVKIVFKTDNEIIQTDEKTTLQSFEDILYNLIKENESLINDYKLVFNK